VSAVLWCLTLHAVFGSAAFAAPPIPIVRPDLELEILDPGVDPQGNPAVIVSRGGDGEELAIDIPPSIIVHRYYYTGDREFQGPRLPGGPTILVATHPRSGERCYLRAQILPGMPRVVYRKNSILYDYGHHAIRIKFPHFGNPVVEYRSGTSWSTKLKRVLLVDQMKNGTSNLLSATKNSVSRRATMTRGFVGGMGDQMAALARPGQRLVPYLPGGVPMTDTYFEESMIRRTEQTKADKGLQRARYEQAVRALDRPALP
jgi:hypothetical protein